MATPTSQREDYICIDFDAICQAFPGRGIGLESLLERGVDYFRELRQCGYAVVILSEQARHPERHQSIRRHLEFIGMPYDVIMPAEVLRQEGFEPRRE